MQNQEAPVRPSRRLALLAALAAALALAGSAQAATIVVKKGGAHPTIQSGVDAAGPNDTVLVEKGVYQENVSVPAGKDGLTIMASGKVRIDARPPGGAGAGPGILINSQDVTIQGFRIKNALNNGGALFGYGIHGKRAGLTVKGCDFTANESADVYVESAPDALIVQCSSWGTFGRCVDVTGEDAVVTKVNVEHCGSDAILVTGNSARVRDCTFDYVHGNAVEFSGDAGVIEDCKATHNNNWCYYVTGNSAVVRDNVLEHGDNWGIHIVGDGADVLNNKISHNSNWGIYVDGNSALVRDNNLRFIANYGIYVSGNSSAVEDNDLRDIFNYGINIDGDDNAVRDNRIRRVSNDAIHYDGLLPNITDNLCSEVFGSSEGISIDGTAVINGLVKRNTVNACGSHGIAITSDCSFFTIQKNTVESCGGQNRDGLHLEGNGHTVSNNEVRGCSGDGFYLAGSSLLVTGNTAMDNGRDGLDVQAGNGCALTNNTAKDNAAEGIENNGTNTTINSNTAKHNRIGFANSGTSSSFTGNSSSDGTHSVPAAPELD